MRYDHLRSAWLPAAETFKAPAARPERIDRIVIHYIGTARAPKDSRRWMLQTHRETMSRPVPFAHMYNAHVSLAGESWEGRGHRYRNAANGASSNASTWSIVFAVDGQNEANPAQVEAVRKLIRDYRRFLGRDIPLIPHRILNATRCPGDGITAQIHSGVFEGDPKVTRIAGRNRFDTAAQVSQRAWPRADTVYVASGEQFADALAAGSLTDGPLLLTRKDSLPIETADEIRRLGAKSVVVIGGPSAVSDAVITQIEKIL